MKLMKRTVRITGLMLAAALMIVVPGNGAARGIGNGHGAGKGRQTSLPVIVASLPFQALSNSEEAGLLKMREEEKLAGDVYRALYAAWGLQVFSTIIPSEQRHMEAVGALLTKYNITDPVTDAEPGAFTDPEMQKLYNSLVERGLQSRVDALHVGATVEDLDIKDLYTLLEQTDNTDIKTVYQNLAKGSRNHLRAFVFELSQNGKIYKAQFLSQEQVNEIVNSPRERGKVDENGVPVPGKNGPRHGKGRRA